MEGEGEEGREEGSRYRRCSPPSDPLTSVHTHIHTCSHIHTNISTPTHDTLKLAYKQSQLQEHRYITHGWVIYKEQGYDSHSSGSQEVQSQGPMPGKSLLVTYTHGRTQKGKRRRREDGRGWTEKRTEGNEGREENTGSITGLEIHVLIFI